MKDIGVAIIGTGFMAAVHVEALRRVCVTVRGILGSSPEKSAQAAESMQLPRGYESLDALLRDDNVHAVHVNTPNRYHLAQASATIRAGKHVLCEKPLAMNRAESAELVALSRKHPNVVTGVNYNVRFYPLCHQAKAMIAAGELGRVFHITGSVAQDWLSRDTDYNWRVLTEEGGELRALSDIGSHWLDLMHFITGKSVQAVCADYTTIHPVRHKPNGEVETFSSTATNQDTTSVPVHTDDYGCVMLRMTDGTKGCVWVSQVSAGRKYCIRFEIAAQNKTLAWNSEQCDQMWVGHRDQPSQSFVRDASVMHPSAGRISAMPAGHAEGYPDSFKQCFRSFYEYIHAGDFTAPKQFASFEDGHRDIVLCDAIIESKRQSRWVALDELIEGTDTL